MACRVSWLFHLMFVFCILPTRAIWAYDITLWQQVLTQFVNEEGLVDYAGLKAKPEQLDTFVESLNAFGPNTNPKQFQDESSRLAYWINTYNALVLYGIKNVYPVSSVTEIYPNFGFFKAQTNLVDGKRYTLDNIEHDIIRATFQDPRIHAALNCGALGCPKLSREPFDPKRLDAQLQTSMEAMVQTSRHVRLDLHTKTLYLSSIFKWFRPDFLNWVSDQKKIENPTLMQYLVLFHSDQTRLVLESIKKPRIVFLNYDWALNKQALND